MQTQNYIPQSLVNLLPEWPLFDLDQVAEFCEKFRDPVQYPKLEKVGRRWDRAIILACTMGAVTCKDPEKKIFLVQTESRQEFFYRVDLKVKLPGVACTCPDDRRHPEIPCKHRLAAVIFRHCIEARHRMLPGDLCRVTRGRHQLTATVLAVYANWIKAEIDELRGDDNHRVTFFDDGEGPIYVKWLLQGENCFAY